MIYFSFFIRLSRSHDHEIVFNGLTRVDLSHFLCHFLIDIFINLIIQHWVRHGRLGIEFHNLF